MRMAPLTKAIAEWTHYGYAIVMQDEPVIMAIGRLERALTRAEIALRELPDVQQISNSNKRLKSEIASALEELDALLGGNESA